MNRSFCKLVTLLLVWSFMLPAQGMFIWQPGATITTQNIRDSAITAPKLATDAVTTVKIAADAVTTAKIADPELKAIAGVTSAANTFPYFTGSGSASVSGVTAYTRSIISTSNGLALRTLAGTINGKAANAVADFGADSTGVSNATTAMQNTLTAVTSGNHRGVYAPAGVYKITPGVLQSFTSAVASSMTGDGGISDTNPVPFRGTMFQSDGSGTGALINIDGGGGLRLADFNIWGNGGATPPYGVSRTGACIGLQIQNRTGDGVGTGSFTFNRLGFQWCSTCLNIGAWDGVESSHDGNNCDNFLLNQCVFVNSGTAIRLNQHQNVQHVLNQCQFTNVDTAIDADKGGVMSVVGVSAFNAGTLLKINSSGLRANFAFYEGGMDNDGTMRPKLLECNGGIVGRVEFNSIGFNPNYIPDYNSPGSGVTNGGACISVRAGYNVTVRKCNFMGGKSGNPIVRFNGGGYVVLDGCEIPANHDYVRDPTGTGGTLRVINCIDEATNLPIPDWGDLNPATLPGGVAFYDEEQTWTQNQYFSQFNGPYLMNGASEHSGLLLFSGAADRTFTFPDASGTLALLSDISGGYVPLTRTVAGKALSSNITLAASDLTNGTTGGGSVVLAASPTFTGSPLAPTAAGGTNTTQVATTAFVTSAVSTSTAGLMELQGTIDCSASPNYPVASKGDTYIVSVAGKIGGASGATVDVGDAIVATSDNSGGVAGAVGGSWTILEHNINAGTITGATLASNVLSSSLTSVGTIGTGAWQGTRVGLAYGGTNVDLSASGSATAVLAQNASHVISARALVATDIPLLDAATITSGKIALANGGTGADLSATGGASKVLMQVNAGDPITVAQLAASDLSNGTTGSNQVVLKTSPTLVTPVLGVAAATTINKVTLTAPASGSTLTIADGKTLTASNTLTLTGTDTSSVAFGAGGTVAYTGTDLGQFASTSSATLKTLISDETGTGGVLVFSTSPTFTTPILGTPTSGTLTNCTLPVGGITGMGTGVGTFLTTPSSANLLSAMTTSTGSGNLVFATTPTLVTPVLGVASATTINKVTLTTPASGSTLTIADGKTLTASNTLTFTGTDSSSVAFGGGGTVLYGNQTITLSGEATGSGTTAITVAAADGWTTLVESADRTSTGAMTNATDMVFAVTANHYYLMESTGALDSANQTNDGAVQVFVDAGTMLGEGSFIAQGASLTAQNVAVTANAAQNTNVLAVGSRASGTTTAYYLTYSFKPSNTTNVRMRFGNNTTNNTNTILKKKSRMRIVDMN